MTLIHHAMARAMPVSGGPPCKTNDRVHFAHLNDYWFAEDVRLHACGQWAILVLGKWMVLDAKDSVSTNPTPPDGGFGRLAR